MRWMFTPLWRYFDFSGRSRRLEFWLYFLLHFIAVAALAMWIFGILVAIGRAGDSGHVVSDAAGSLGPALTLFGIFMAATIIPSIAVQVRRFHDQDMSGLLVLLNLVPGVGGLIVLIFMALEGTKGPNRFGADPREP
jgi:uncharacterized membrane protein YhaH (DUF805 family)